MNRPIKVALYGVGVVSNLIAKALLKKRGIEIISATDVAEDKIGRDLGDVLGLSYKMDIPVAKDIDEAFSKAKPDIVIHATVSDLRSVYPQINECIRKGVHVISTCEELVYPYLKNRTMAEEIDKQARKYGVSVLGSGINPGFLMDTLPITLTGPCLDVKKIKVTRMMNSGRRRLPYQKKIGTGLTPDEFRDKINKKEITGHVGLAISIAMIADSLGWKLDKVIESPPEPVISDKVIKTSYATVQIGQVAGLKSTASGIMGEERVIDLEFVSHARVEEEFDFIEITGLPSFKVKIEGGVHGDTGTAAMIINSIPKVLNATPGLHTMKDLPIPSAALSEMNEFVII